jgi:hypothetical protein
MADFFTRVPGPLEVMRRLGLNVPSSKQLGKFFTAAPEFVGPQADVAGMVRDAGQVMPNIQAGDYGQAFGNLGMAAAAIPFMAVPFATVAGVKKGAKGLFGDTGSGKIPTGSGGPHTAPGGVPALPNTGSVPQPLPSYPKTEFPEWRFDPKKLRASEIDTKTPMSIVETRQPKRRGDYLGKVNSEEANLIKKQVAAAQRDIDAGNYTPMFDVSKRSDVNPKSYNIGSSTQKDAWASRPETREIHRLKAQHPDGLKRLEDAFREGTKIQNSNNWYYMRQLEEAFIKELGPKAGRKAFKEKFAQSMAATTGGAAPKGNLRTAMYGNFLKENKIPYPEFAYDMPFPAGGQYVSGNVRMHKKFSNQGIDTAHPKRFNFQSNFLGDPKSATVDKQMSQLFDPKLAEPAKGSYGAYEEVVINLAKKHNVSPREFQEVAWAGAKKGREGARYPGSRPMIEEVNQAIERTARVTGLTPKQVLTQGIIKSKIPIYGLAGGGLFAPAFMDNE